MLRGRSGTEQAVRPRGRPRIVHIITTLTTGGAEKMLCKLIQATDPQEFESFVIVLGDKDATAAPLEALGVKIFCLRSQPGLAVPLLFLKVHRLLRELQPDLIQCWMYHANLVGLVANTLSVRRVPIVWNIRASLSPALMGKFSTGLTVRLCKLLSRFVTRIVYNSSRSKAQHEAMGYRSERAVLIGNAFDLSLYYCSPERRTLVRSLIGSAEIDFIFGHVGSYHPRKDHRTLLAAAAEVVKVSPRTHFVLVGSGTETQRSAIASTIDALNLHKNVHLLGRRDDVAEILGGCDGALLCSSWAEAFPNALGEAMATGLPCVVTDVGDCAKLVGVSGTVVQPERVPELAAALLSITKLSALERQTRGAALRANIAKIGELKSVVSVYNQMYREIVGGAEVQQPVRAVNEE